jgi:phosphodiesterase/alkaline phosphatase D-like protein
VEPTPPANIEAIDFGLATKPGTARGGTMRFWFKDWTISGTKVDAHPDRAFGPILFAMHTLSRDVLKMTAQMAPLGNAPKDVRLEVQEAGSWKEIASTTIDSDARTARFRVENWDAAKDTPYRVAYRMNDDSGTPRDYYFGGTVRRDPVDKPEIVVAAFTGNNDFGFPHADVVKHVSHFNPDFLAYTGDNIYERVGEYGVERSPVDRAILDYLRKWYMFGWEYRDLLKDMPAVALPDDHDVYHGNIWGAGGRHADGTGYEGQDKGGYTMPAGFVNAVQRTQTSNMPDPHDTTPVEQGISVYYTSLLYGGVSFAIVEDRKWKSAPTEMLPKAEIINGWPQNLRYDAARDGDVRGAELLGKRQLDFLNSWAVDWSGGAWIKAVISQTIFANVATLPKGSVTDAITSKLRVLPPGEYAEGDARVMDHDSNGWPQTPRNNALRAMRRGLAFHIAGDQHLGSTVQYGIDDWNDAAYAICVPSVANIFPRRWFPPEEGRNRKPGSPKNTGEYLDGFGNKVTVHAVSNPTTVDVEPTAINQRAPGYGIVTFDRATRKTTMANWPRWVDPSVPDAKPYDGWPITIDQLDNGLSAAKWVLDAIESPGEDDPVVHVIDESNKETVYTLRIKGRSFVPRVFRAGLYTVKVGENTYAGQRARRE